MVDAVKPPWLAMETSLHPYAQTPPGDISWRCTILVDRNPLWILLYTISSCMISSDFGLPAFANVDRSCLSDVEMPANAHEQCFCISFIPASGNDDTTSNIYETLRPMGEKQKYQFFHWLNQDWTAINPGFGANPKTWRGAFDKSESLDFHGTLRTSNIQDPDGSGNYLL